LEEEILLIIGELANICNVTPKTLHSTQLLVAVTKIQKALLDVLYDDWVDGRWELDETVFN